MPFAKKDDAIQKNGKLRKGFSESVGKDGKTRYLKQVPKKAVKPVQMMTVKKLAKVTSKPTDVSDTKPKKVNVKKEPKEETIKNSVVNESF